MGVEYDNAAINSGYGVTMLSTNITIGSDDNRAAVVGLHEYGHDLTGDSFSGSVGGQSLTEIQLYYANTSGIYVFGGINPTSGSQTASLSWETTTNWVYLGVITAKNATQTNPFENVVTATTGYNGDAISCEITSSTGDMTISFVLCNGSDVSTNQTLRYSNGDNRCADTGPGTGTTTHTWTPVGSSTKTMIGLNIKQASSTPVETLTETVGAAIALQDLQNYTDALTVQAGSSVSLADLQAYMDMIQTAAGAAVSSEDRQTYIDILASLIGAKITQTDLQGYRDVLVSPIGASITITDLRGFTETLLSTIGSAIAGTDIQNYQDILTTAIGAGVSVSDLQTYCEIASTLIGADVSIVDVTAYGHEMLSITVGVRISLEEYYFLEIEFGETAPARKFIDTAATRTFTDRPKARKFTDVAPRKEIH